MYGFLYYYVKPKYGEKAKLCSMDRDSFIVHVKTDDSYKGIAKDVETRFYILNYELNRPLSKWKNKKKVIGLIKYKLGGKIKTFVRLSAKTYNCLIDDGSEDKKVKHTKKCVIEKPLNLKIKEYILEATKAEKKINCQEKIEIDVDSLK